MDSSLLTGVGLAAPAGLNAYLPLLILALAGRFSDAIPLGHPYDLISTPWGIAVITLLLTVEIVVDKVPGLDHANDLIQSVIRPASGSVLTLASTADRGSINPVVAVVLGLVIAGSVHAVKATTRPMVTLTTGGLGNPLVSTAEDGVAAVTAATAIFLPILAIVLILLFGLLVICGIRYGRRRLARI